MTETARPAHDEMFCSSCGSIMKRAAEICMQCGVRVRHRPDQFVQVNRALNVASPPREQPNDSVTNWLFGFNGRIGRQGFVMRWGLAFAVLLLYYAMVASRPEGLLSVVSLIVLGVAFLLYVSAVIRRLHDFDKSGWWALFIAVPLANLFLWIACMFGRGDSLSGNTYGYRGR